MSETIGEIAVATAFLIAGSLILTNLSTLTNFDQSSGLKLHSWFKKTLGAESKWNREIYSVGTTSGHKRSRVGFIVVGVLCLLAGFVSLSLVLAGYIR